MKIVSYEESNDTFNVRSFTGTVSPMQARLFSPLMRKGDNEPADLVGRYFKLDEILYY